MTILVHTDGRIEMIYSDEFVDLLQAGEYTIRRVSNVEPDGRGGWQADLGRVNGPVLEGFKLRQEALDAEVQWLKANLLGGIA